MGQWQGLEHFERLSTILARRCVVLYFRGLEQGNYFDRDKFQSGIQAFDTLTVRTEYNLKKSVSRS